MKDLYVEVQGGEIVVTLPPTHYTVTYYKPSNSPQLLAKRMGVSGKGQPEAAPISADRVLARCVAGVRQRPRQSRVRGGAIVLVVGTVANQLPERNVNGSRSATALGGVRVSEEQDV